MKVEVKKALEHLQAAIDVLEKIKGQNENVDEAADEIRYAFADLEYEVN